MKKTFIARVLLAVSIACATVGCGNNESLGKSASDGSTNKIVSDNKGNNEKTNNDETNSNRVDTINENYNELYSNIVCAMISTRKWNDDPNYVFTQDDFKQFFNGLSAENNYYQLTLSKGLAAFNDSDEVYIASTGAKYYYLCNADVYSAYLNKMFGVREDFYKDLTSEDLSISNLIYDQETDAIYYHPGIVDCISCFYSYSEVADDYSILHCYEVSSDIDDDTNLDGVITLKTYEYDCIGWWVSLDSISFEKK